MICKIQVVIIREDAREEARELACLDRGDLKPETLGSDLGGKQNDIERPAADRSRTPSVELAVAKNELVQIAASRAKARVSTPFRCASSSANSLRGVQGFQFL
jgi:hypothetical protein